MNRDVIINKTFTRAFLGYDAGEVDSFLDEVIREFDRIKQELDVARLRNKMLLEELERFHESAAEQKREQAESTANAQAAPGQEQQFSPGTHTVLRPSLRANPRQRKRKRLNPKPKAPRRRRLRAKQRPNRNPMKRRRLRAKILPMLRWMARRMRKNQHLNRRRSIPKAECITSAYNLDPFCR